MDIFGQFLGKQGQLNLFHGVRANVKKYGKIFGFYMGRDPAIVISDFEVQLDFDCIIIKSFLSLYAF